MIEIGAQQSGQGKQLVESWWSQAGSNRRPRHCERRALPAELWPHAPAEKKQATIPVIYNPLQHQVKNGQIAVLRFICGELDLFAEGGTGI